ncbi:MFS transporter [Rhizobium sp. PAMB 3182]
MNQMSPGVPVRAPFMPKQRIAVSLLFLINGYMIGNWAPKIPEFIDRLGLTSGEMGLMIMAFGIGSLVLMPFAGAAIAHRGSRLVSRVTALLLLPGMLMLTFAPNWWLAAAALFYFGGMIGAMDVAMNANAVVVEKSMGRAIMSSCHGFWSLGGLIGAATGGYLIVHLGVVGHTLVLTALATMLLLVAWAEIETDAPHPEDEKLKVSLPLTPLPWLIGIMALFSMIPEGSVLDWGALYLRNELGTTLTHSGFAFAGFSLTMAAMRFAGDFVRDRFGAVMTLRICALAAMTGLLIAGFAPNATVAILGFTVCGIGISNMVPIAFSAAGNLPGLPPGVGISVATFLGYSGLLFAPSIIGFIAEHTGFAPLYAGLSILIMVVLGLSRLASHADAA